MSQNQHQLGLIGSEHCGQRISDAGTHAREGCPAYREGKCRDQNCGWVLQMLLNQNQNDIAVVTATAV